MSILASLQSPADLRRLPVESLPAVADELRRAIYDQVSRTGGHLAPNLGVVELTIALHYVFDFAWDRLLFDVGHQCYPHKLLTGRLPMLADLRTRRGMAGFPEPRESPFDLFAVGHAGTGISTAVGMARGDSLNNEAFDPRANPAGRRVVTLIGDASIVNGVAMEGLNNAGTLGRQFLVVLNDNGMSIGKPQGAVAQYFDRLRLSHTYAGLKRSAKNILRHLPGGQFIGGAYHKAGEATKAVVNEGAWFEHFGLVTVGPIDGHDLPALVEFLAEARDFARPMVLHVKTIKGKGYEFAERDSEKFHSPAAFRVLSADPDAEHPLPEGGGRGVGAPSSSPPLPKGGGWGKGSSSASSSDCRIELRTDGRSFTAAFGDALADLMSRDPKIVACTAAMPDGTGLSRVMPKFPDRTWDTGICESHAMDMMAGLAKTGWKPFFAVYCTFLQRAFDQAFQEVALQGLPVRLCLDRAGLVGGDGAVHHGFCDVALLRTLPGACVMAAIDEPSLIAALEFMRGYEAGLSAVRYPRDMVSPRLAADPCPPFELGRARFLALGGPTLRVGSSPGLGGQVSHLPLPLAASSGAPVYLAPSSPSPSDQAEPVSIPSLQTIPDCDAAVLAFGTPALDALAAVEQLAGEYRIAVWDARFAKPIDTALLRALLTRGVPIVTVEDHSVIGGFGSAVLEAAAAMGLDASRVHMLGLPDSWVHQDSRSSQLAEVGLDAAGIARAVRRAVAGGPVSTGAPAGTAEPTPRVGTADHAAPLHATPGV